VLVAGGPSLQVSR